MPLVTAQEPSKHINGSGLSKTNLFRNETLARYWRPPQLKNSYSLHLVEALWSVLTFQCAIYPFVRRSPVPADWEFFWDKNLCTPGPSQAIGTSRYQSREGEHQPVAFGENQSCRLRSLPSWKLILTLSCYGCQLSTIFDRSYYSDTHFPFFKGYQF